MKGACKYHKVNYRAVYGLRKNGNNLIFNNKEMVKEIVPYPINEVLLRGQQKGYKELLLTWESGYYVK